MSDSKQTPTPFSFPEAGPFLIVLAFGSLAFEILR